MPDRPEHDTLWSWCDFVGKYFYERFGRTPLTERQDDIVGEALELKRATDVRNLREEFGDIFASVLAGIHECGWDPEELLMENYAKTFRRKEQYAAQGAKIKVAILGGAFDPITPGHIQIGQFVLRASRIFQEVWLMPCFKHMNNKRMASNNHRLAMCGLACEADMRIRVFNYEMEHQLSGESYKTFKMLLEETYAKDQYDFSFIIGQDNANTFETWPNHEALERLVRFVVVPRQGYSPNPGMQWYMRPPHIWLADEQYPIMDISSTILRELLAAGNPEVAKLIDSKVLRYIQDNKLYLQ